MTSRISARLALGADLVDVRALIAAARAKADQVHDALADADARLDAIDSDIVAARAAIVDLRQRVAALEAKP